MAGSSDRSTPAAITASPMPEILQTIGRGTAADIGRVLADWLAEHIQGASEISIGELRAPGANGFSNITALFDAAWRSQGIEKRRRLVARIEPTGEGLFPTYHVGRQFH